MTDILFIVFLTLKLSGVIDWSWWWVTSPIWGPFVLLIAFLALAMIAEGVGEIVGGFWRRATASERPPART